MTLERSLSMDSDHNGGSVVQTEVGAKLWLLVAASALCTTSTVSYGRTVDVMKMRSLIP